MKYVWLLLLVLGVGVAAYFRDRAPGLIGMMKGEAPAATKAAKAAPAAVPVIVAPVRVKAMPVEFCSLGTVQTESTVTVKVRVDSVVERVLVRDGAFVKEGDILVELDKRQIDAQIEQAQAAIKRGEAQIEQAKRNDERSTDLAQRGVTSRVTADDARTAASVALANKAADEALLKNLRLLRTFHTITAPISGRIGVVAVRPGALLRSADANSIIATINQIDPIYVAIAVPQDLFAQTMDSMRSGLARVELTAPGTASTISGTVFMVDNAVDNATGLITVRSKVANPDARIWPGQIAQARLVLREEPNALVVPNEAVQTSQAGPYVFVVEANTARLRRVRVARTVGGETVVADGLKAGEVVVTDGHLRVVDGRSVSPSPDRGAADRAQDTENIE
ncbi:MAG: efflux RND transporter periplasmic adaptor subunit [Hyphomicrobiaceae bacterium]|nr:efflux RND transporter periplasmic adaptor subunit [Hyphomicrobiaceae bacterium]